MADPANVIIDQSGGEFRLGNRQLRLSGHLPSARISLALSGTAEPALAGATYGFRISGAAEGGESRRPSVGIPSAVTTGSFDDAALGIRGAEITLSHDWPDGLTAAWRLRLADDEPWLLLDLDLENRGTHPIVVQSLQPLSVLPSIGGRLARNSPSAWSYYTQGWQSWSPTAPRGAGDSPLQSRPPMSGPRRPPADTHPSHWVTLLPIGERSTSLLAGYLTLRDIFGEL
ncbi:MAG TPA: hypothetical protein VKU87_06275, partial [Thermomicrobiaceae bacterium]|nr:hypothetical protein [Thermomicrobiaceae bacterium]